MKALAALIVCTVMVAGCASKFGNCGGMWFTRGDSIAHGLVVTGKADLTLTPEGEISGITVSDGTIEMCHIQGGQISPQMADMVSVLIPATAAAALKAGLEGPSPLE